MGGGTTRHPKGGSKRQCAGVKRLLHGVFHLVSCLDELIDLLLHARLLGKGHDNSVAERRDRKTASGQARRRRPKLLAATSKVPIRWTGNRRAQA